MPNRYDRLIHKLADARYRLDIPAKKSPTGMRIRERFDTQAEAHGRALEIFVERENVAIAISNITPAQALDACRALALLEPYPGVSLFDAVRGYVEVLKLRHSSVPFGELFDLFLQSKAKRSATYQTQLKWAKERLKPLHEKLTSDITVRDLDEVLKGERPTVRNAFMRYLRAVFNYGVKRDYLAFNPVLKLDFEEIANGETEVLEPERVKKILLDCLDHDLEFLPYRVFGIFCGIRPEGELARVEWEDLDWRGKVLKLRAEITKKKRRRFVDISDNAMAWLEEYRRQGAKTTGLIAPFTKAELRTKHRANWARVVGADKKGRPKERWVQQIMRHSFCSYWLVEHNNDADGLVIQSGHESKEVMWDSYYRATTKPKTKKFWSIKPPAPASENVVPFADAGA